MKNSKQFKTTLLKITLVSMCLFTKGAVAQQADVNENIKAEKYCAVLKNDGRLVVVSLGKEMLTGVRLDNGTIIKSEGIVIKSDGTQILLKNGECLDTTGNRIKSKNNKLNNEKKIIPPAQK